MVEVILVAIGVYVLYQDIYKGIVLEEIKKRRIKKQEYAKWQDNFERANFEYYKMRHGDFAEYETYEDFCKAVR
jgi:hypothetical protein